MVKKVGRGWETNEEEKARVTTLGTMDNLSVNLKALGVNLAGFQRGGLSTNMDAVAPVEQESPAVGSAPDPVDWEEFFRWEEQALQVDP